MPAFVPSLELNADFYAEIIEPLVRPYPHAAALLGHGSDILGYDTARSTDHDWGLRLQVFVDSEDVDEVQCVVDNCVPGFFRGWSTVLHADKRESCARVDVTSLDDWLINHLGVNPRLGLSNVDWLVVPQQLLLGVVRGAVYRDPDGELEEVRAQLAYLPDDVWRWILACQWRRLAQEEHLIGRAAQAGDELGSRVASAHQVRELMRLAFLLDRTYWPYTKWFGTAFARLSSEPGLKASLEAALSADRYMPIGIRPCAVLMDSSRPSTRTCSATRRARRGSEPSTTSRRARPGATKLTLLRTWRRGPGLCGGSEGSVASGRDRF